MQSSSGDKKKSIRAQEKRNEHRSKEGGDGSYSLEDVNEQPAVAMSPKRRKRKRRRSKNPNLPKQPLSAYNCFFREERLKWLREQEPQANEQDRGSQPFYQMGRDIGGRWKLLSPGGRAKYEEMARKEQERYHGEMALYRQNQEAAVQESISEDNAKPAFQVQAQASTATCLAPAQRDSAHSLSQPQESLHAPSQEENDSYSASPSRQRPRLASTTSPRAAAQRGMRTGDSQPHLSSDHARLLLQEAEQLHALGDTRERLMTSTLNRNQYQDEGYSSGPRFLPWQRGQLQLMTARPTSSAQDLLQQQQLQALNDAAGLATSTLSYGQNQDQGNLSGTRFLPLQGQQLQLMPAAPASSAQDLLQRYQPTTGQLTSSGSSSSGQDSLTLDALAALLGPNILPNLRTARGDYSPYAMASSMGRDLYSPGNDGRMNQMNSSMNASADTLLGVLGRQAEESQLRAAVAGAALNNASQRYNGLDVAGAPFVVGVEHGIVPANAPANAAGFATRMQFVPNSLSSHSIADTVLSRRSSSNASSQWNTTDQAYIARLLQQLTRQDPEHSTERGNAAGPWRERRFDY